MSNAFMNDVIGIERKYLSVNSKVPECLIFRLNKLLDEMTDEERQKNAIYIEKFKKMTGDKSWTIEDLHDEMDKLMELVKFDYKIVLYVTCSQMVKMMGDLVTQAKHVERNCKRDFSSTRLRVDYVLTSITRKLLPALIAHKAYHGDVLHNPEDCLF